MSENERENAAAADADPAAPGGTIAEQAVDPVSQSGDETESSAKLSSLMASGAKAGQGKTRPDLDAEAVLAAQAAIAEGERALAAARAQLATERPQPARGSRKRELALRLLLAANVLAMIVVAVLPPQTASQSESQQTPSSGEPPPRPEVESAGPRLADKYNQALLASESGDWAGAITLLKEYLEESPRMPASRLVNVYRAMAHYAGAINRFSEAEEYERKAQLVTRSHSLPEDLIAMAKAAKDSNDQEGLRQVWARFLLQQRQIPSSLYQHVAEAYLQLGDSYRVQANEAGEKARLEELQRTESLLRDQASAREGGK
ncbi:MAG: hypothetical protein KDC98_05565 [Planctomycetes bacterium]|nr:hypothetical protein [Planctomycetota bacterium]